MPWDWRYYAASPGAKDKLRSLETHYRHLPRLQKFGDDHRYVLCSGRSVVAPSLHDKLYLIPNKTYS